MNRKVLYEIDFSNLYQDGYSDDYIGLQEIINNNSNIVFPKNKKFRISSALIVDSNKIIDLNGSEIIIDSSAYPNNYCFIVRQPTISTDSFNITQPINRCDNYIALQSYILQKYDTGDFVRLDLGESPFDPNEEHFGVNCKILSKDSNGIFIDRQVLYDINIGNKINIIAKISNNKFDLFNGKLSYINGQIPDSLIHIENVNNIKIYDISYNATMFINLASCENVEIFNCTGVQNHISGHTASGRFITAWMSRNITISNCICTGFNFGSTIFLETHCKNVEISNCILNIINSNNIQPNNAIIHLDADSNLNFVNNTINCNSLNFISISNGSTINGNINSINYKFIFTFIPFGNSFFLNGKKFNKFNFTREIKLIPNAIDNKLRFLKNTFISELIVKGINIDNSTHIFLLNDLLSGFDITNIDLNKDDFLKKWNNIGNQGFYNYLVNNENIPKELNFHLYSNSNESGKIRIDGIGYLLENEYYFINSNESF